MDCGATERILEQRACEVLNSIRRMWRPGILVVKLGRYIIYLIGISSHERNIINVFSKVIFKTNLAEIIRIRIGLLKEIIGLGEQTFQT